MHAIAIRAHQEARPTHPNPVSAPRGWEELSRSERMSMFGDMAFEILCGQIHRDYTSFFKRHVLSRMERAARPSLKESNVMIALWSLERPLTGSEVCQNLRARPSAISRTLASLEERSWVEQEPCEQDSRATCNALTPDGRQVASQMLHYWAVAVEKAEMLTGSQLDATIYAQWTADIHAIKDRAFAFREFKPGRLNTFHVGMSRPARADRHTAQEAFYLKDSYLRFYALAAHRDYLDCLSRRAVKPVLKGTGLTLRELRVLMCVDFYQSRLSQSEIASVLRMDTATVARATQALEQGGFVKLFDDMDDERLCLLELSESGQALAERYRERCITMSERIDIQYDLGTTPERLRDLMRTLSAIRDRAAAFADLAELPAADPRA